MRMETSRVVTAFLAKKPLKAARTDTDGRAMYLHGNKIAWHNPDGSISMTLAGWATNTTRERLNGVCELSFGYRPFRQKNLIQYWNKDPIRERTIITVHPIFDQAAQ